MKFVCDNCKAKYQIGDDKVSGKTVRMKCRKCGHLILVSAAVTESSVSRAAPAEGTQLGSSASGSTPLPAASPTESTAGPPAGLGEPAPDDDEDGATKIMKVPPRVPGRPAAPARPTTGGLRVPAAPRSGSAPPPTASGSGLASAPPTRPATGGTPRPPAARPSIPRAVGTSGLGTSGLGTSGLAPQPTPSAPSLGDLAQRSMSNAISTAARSSGPTPAPRSMSPARGVPAVGGAGAAPAGESLAGAPAPAGGGVAGAFQRAVAGTQPVLKAETPGEDWYVGVGGVPLGPVRLSVIREKVDQGAVDGESLVWREGFDEWQPLRNVPGLRAILDERKAAAPLVEAPRLSSASLPRVSAPTPIPGALHVGAVPPPPTPPPPAVNGANGHGALSVGHVPTGGVSLGPAAGPAAASAAEPSAAPLGDVALGALAASPAAAPLGAAAAVPISGPIAAPGGPTSLASPSVPPPARERKGMHPFAYAMIAMAAVFGGVAAWVLLKPAPQQVIVVQSAAAPTVPGLAAAPPPPPTSEPSAEASASEPKGTGPKVASGGPGAKTTADPGASSKPGDPPPNLGGSFDQGVGGPNSGPGKDGASSGRGQLSEGEISGVVQRNMAGVRRRCWQPALDARSASAPKSARVSTSVTISPSGSVSSVSASGSETHFPGLASCIGGAIRGWQFPPSDGPTTVNIPFSFNAQ